MFPLRKIVYSLVVPLSLSAGVIPSTEGEVANYLEQAQEESIPHFLCGDLNIPYRSEEPAELILPDAA